MECYAVKPDRELLFATAPENIVKKVFDEGEDTLLFAGFSGGKMVSYAVFSHPLKTAREVWLSYIYTAESYREQGMATELLSSSEEYLKKKSVTDILLKSIMRSHEAEEFLHFFVKRGFFPLSVSGRCLIYQYRDMLDPGVFELLEKKKEKLPPISHFKDINKKLLSLVPVKIRREDEELSCFLIAKDRIYGVAAACPIEDFSANTEGETAVCINEIWLDEDARKKGLFLPLFHAVCEEACRTMSEDMRIQLFLKDDAAYHGLLQMFNPPEQEYLVQEYIKPLNKRN